MKIISAIIRPGKAIKLIVALFLIVLVISHFQGYLSPIAAYLDSEKLTFSVGEKNISAYTIIKALISIILLFWAASIATTSSEKYIHRLKIRNSNRELLIKSFQVVIYIAVFFLFLEILNIDLTALAIFSGAVGIGVGFGLQKITSNFISGIILLFEKSVEIDDLIELSDGTYGFVRESSSRYTLIETFDSKEILIPNEDFITNRVINWTYSSKKGRIEIPIGVSYKSDIKEAYKLMLETAKAHERCSKDPEPVCYLKEFGDSSVNFLLHLWVDDVTQGRFSVQSDVLFSIWDKFKENDIEIPFPQRDLHIKNPEALSSK